MRLVLALILCTACSAEKVTTGLQAVGDSMFDWNDEDSSIPAVVAANLGLPFQNNAIGGTTITEVGFPIPEQYEAGTWDWVLVDGGGNDLNDGCECRQCDAVMEEIITADAEQGAMADFVEQIVDDGYNVALMGYYEMPNNAEYGFDQCNDELGVLLPRYQLLAERFERVTFIDIREVVSPQTTPQAYDEDQVHPSTEGARMIAEHIASVLRASNLRD